MSQEVCNTIAKILFLLVIRNFLYQLSNQGFTYYTFYIVKLFQLAKLYQSHRNFTISARTMADNIIFVQKHLLQMSTYVRTYVRTSCFYLCLNIYGRVRVFRGLCYNIQTAIYVNVYFAPCVIIKKVSSFINIAAFIILATPHYPTRLSFANSSCALGSYSRFFLEVYPKGA